MFPILTVAAVLCTLAVGQSQLICPDPRNTIAYDIQPRSGAFGTQVRITGCGLSNVKEVRFVSALNVSVRTLAVASDGSLHFTTNQSNLPVDVRASVDLYDVSGRRLASFNNSYWEWLQHIDVYSFTPTTGGQSGTIFTINGCFPPKCGGRSTSLTNITIGGIEAEILSQDNKDVKVKAGYSPRAIPSAQIVFTAESGATSTGRRPWNYLEPGMIRTVTPNTGQRGTRVRVSGDSLLGVRLNSANKRETIAGNALDIKSVTLAGLQCTVLSASPSLIIVQVSSGFPRSGDVRIETNAGPFVVNETSWTQLSDGTITSVTPSTMQPGGDVALCGMNLLGGGSSIITLSMAGQNSSNPSFQKLNSSCIITKAPLVPQSLPASGPVVIVADTYATVDSQMGVDFAYARIDSVTPMTGRLGTYVTIAGSHLDLRTGGIDSVYLSGVQAQILPVVSFQTISVRAGIGPASGSPSPGSVKIVGRGLNTLNGMIELALTLNSSWTYIQAGNITRLTPAEGQVGTRVNITGQFLLGNGKKITFVGIGEYTAEVLFSSNTLVVVSTPLPRSQNFDTPVNVVVESTLGEQTTRQGSFTFRRPGNITSISPRSGQLGTRVTLRGTNLLGNGTSLQGATLSGIPANIMTQTNNLVVLIAGESNVSQSGPIMLTSVNGAIVTAALQWKYDVPGRIVSVTPPQGQVGTRVIIDGTNLLGGGAHPDSVNLSGIPAELVSFSSSRIVVRLVADVKNDVTGDIIITSNTGATVILRQSWTYKPRGVITGISPSTGQLGTRVTITGNNVLGYGSSVLNATVAGVPILSVVDASSSRMVVLRVGEGAEGASGNVLIYADTEASISSQNIFFTYSQPGNISSVLPSSGVEGTFVVIRGDKLRGGGRYVDSVTLSGVAVSQIVYDSETEIIVIAGPTPPGAPTPPGRVDIASDTGAITRSEQQFSYSTPIRISSISPTSGQTGTRVRIVLTVNSSMVRTVHVGDTEASVTSRQGNSMFIRLGRPARQGTFLGDVAVVFRSGVIGRQANGFTYTSEGIIFTVSPGSGQIGTLVTITGENLLGNGTRLLNASLAGLTGHIMSSSNTEAVIIVSDHSLVRNVGSLTVESDTGAVVTRIDGWESIPAGVIQSVSPNVGQLGTIVTVKGVRLFGGGTKLVAVSLSGIPVLSIVSANDSTVVVQAADGGSTVNQRLQVTLISDTGSRVELQQGWTYRSSGHITSVSPSSGQYATRVTVRGSNLLGQGSSVRVTLGKTESLTVESTNNTAIVIRANGVVNVTGIMENVTITANTGAFIIATATWMYRESGIITSVYPPSGQQGTEVVVRGSNLFGYGARIATATIGKVPATVRQQTNGEVIISAGMSSVGHGLDIVLESNSGAQVTAQRAFEYLTPGGVESVQPVSGLGGAVVVITGSELFGYGQRLRSVTLAGIPATFDRFSINSSVITVTAGPNSGGMVTGPIVITSSSGATVNNMNWTYISRDLAQISNISPSSGLPGTFATLSGSNLLSAWTAVRSVIVNGSPSISIQSASNTSIRFRLGPPVPSGQSQIGVSIVLDTGSTYSTSANLFTYMVGGMVVSVSPAAGHGGATVWIRGTNLLNGGNISEVFLAGVRAQTIQTSNDTVVIVTAGSGFDVTGDVVVVSSNGLVSGLHNGWQYLPYIPLSLVSPSQGQDGTRVTITAQRALLSFRVTSVYLAGVEAQLDSTNTTRTFSDDRNNTVVEVIQQLALVARARSSPGTGNVVLRSNQGEELVIDGRWSYLPLQVVENVTPQSGYRGTRVTITGRNLLAGGSRISSVTLAGVPTRVLEETINSGGRNVVVLEVTPDKQMVGPPPGNIVITSDNGAKAVPSGRQWTFLDVHIASVGPSVGQFGTRVTITGTNLLAGGSISNATLAGILAKTLSSTNSRVVLEATYSPPTETGEIVLNMNTGAQVVIPRQWAYIEQGNITSVEPTLGREGTVVGITGTGLLGGGNVASDVFLDGVPVREVSASSPLYVQVVAGRSPSGGSTQPGEVRIVADTGAIVSISNRFQYVTVGTVTGLSPRSGQYGTEVTIQGIGFLSGASSLQYVKLGGVEAAVIGQPTNTNVTVRAGLPPRLDTFSGDVEVRSANGGITGSDRHVQFSYVNPGQIYTLSPSSGQLGTYVRITGERLYGGGSTLTAVSLGAARATILSPGTNEEVRIRAGSSLVPGKVNVTLVSNTGATVVKLDGWQYLPPSTITAVSPSSGRQGTRIRITGTRLTGGGSTITSVRLSGVEVMWLTVGTNYVDVRAGNGSTATSPTGDVVVTSDTGAQTIRTNGFTYESSGRIITITPASGISDQEVNITGVNLLGRGNKIVTVSFGGIGARVVRSNDTLVTVEIGLNVDGEPKPNVDVYLEADTGDATYATGAWSYSASCTGNQFGVYPNNCTNCSATCNRCFDVGNNNCRQCRYFTIPTNTTNGKLCVLSCPKFADVTTCVDSCRSSQFQFENKSSDTANTTLRFCLNCSSHCNPNDGCTGPGVTDCRVCRNVSDEGVCKTECPVDKYADKNRFCQPCHSECQTGFGCRGPNAWDCNRCANYNVTRSSIDKDVNNDPATRLAAPVLTITVCVSSCSEDYYALGSQCIECSDQCLKGCTGSQPHQCVNCRNYRKENGLDSCVATCNTDPGRIFFYANRSTNRCERCHQQCSLDGGCRGPEVTDCNGCRNLTLSDVGNRSVCVGQCPSNYYADEQFICRKCDASCSSGCNGPSASDCFSSSSSVGTFDAGTGTIAVVAAICAVLLVMVIVLFCWYCSKIRRKDYSLNDIPLAPTRTDRPYEDSSVLKRGEKETSIDKRPAAAIPGTDSGPRPLSASPLLKEENEENYTPMGANNPIDIEAEEYTAMDGPEPIADTLYVDTDQEPPPGRSKSPQKTISSKTLPPPTTQDVYDDIGPDEGDQLYESVTPAMVTGKESKGKKKAKTLGQPSKSTPALSAIPKNEPPAPSLPPRDQKPQDVPFPLPPRIQPPPERAPKLGPKPSGSEPPPPPVQPRSPISISPLPPVLGPRPGQGSDVPALPPRNQANPSEEDLYEDCSNVEID